MPPHLIRKNVLVADDSSVIRTIIGHVLKRLDYNVLTAENGEQCIASIEQNQVDVLLLDLSMPLKSGLDVLSWMQENAVALPTIIITAMEDISQAVQCIKMGAYEYLTKPVDKQRLEILLRNALAESGLKQQINELKKELKQKDIFHFIHGNSPVVKQCVDQAMQVMETDMNVLINGESGTGKELFAQAIHNGSKRKEGPFVTINCAAISNDLAESLLFGHVKGSFTGASSDHIGYFEQADHGTIFLDEIGDMNIDIQAKVLRVLQEKKIRRIGEKKERPVDFRLISATHRDFSEAIATNLFRADLYYRLEEYPLYIPPLRERNGDIILLAQYFLKEFCKANNIEPPEISAEAKSTLLSSRWPGNIRELQNVIRRAVINRRGDTIDSFNLPPGSGHVHVAPLEMNGSSLPAERNLEERRTDIAVKAKEGQPILRDIELQAILNAYNECGGNQTKAAGLLGISRSTLIRKMKQYELTKKILVNS
ncbi:MAG: sigma-54-dependent Fis family transcriptional regulator [Chlorobiaceae bacterium]|nr:sigma-54-dependent Fis family transcriptional regulator [Chlorobiaceae bacterium]